MEIREPSYDDLSVRDVLVFAGVSDKTLRRAVRAGELPRRYILGARGPQLVFRRVDVERWLAAHTRRRPRHADVTPSALARVDATLLDILRPLHAALIRSQEAMADVCAQLEKQAQQVAVARAVIDGLAAQIACADDQTGG
jgi:predicted DNA-binding transcriptional regulator AlpA